MKRLAFIPIMVFAFVALAVPMTASAHATPITYEPENFSELETVPDKIRIHFSERIEKNASQIRVIAPDKSIANPEGGVVSPDDPHYFESKLQNKGKGTYVVNWSVVSADDGHFTKGAFAFSVGEEIAVPADVSGQIQIQHITTIPQATAIFLELLGQAILIGAVLFLFFIYREMISESDIRRFTLFSISGVFLIVLGTVSFIVLKTFDLIQLNPANFTASLRTFIQTTDGFYTLLRAFLGILAGIWIFIRRRHIFRRSLEKWLLASLVFVIILLRARVSHAAASDIFPAFSILVNAVHLFSKEAWIGILAALIFLVLPGLANDNFNVKSLSQKASKWLAFLIGMAATTGVYVVWLHLKGWQFARTTEWGGVFIILTTMAVFFLSMRVVNQYRGENNLLKIKNGLSFEFMLGVAVLFVTSLLIITTPPYPLSSYGFELSEEDRGREITLSVNPYNPKEMLISVSEEESKSYFDVKDVVLTAENKTERVGPLVLSNNKISPTKFVFERKKLTPDGEWFLRANAREPGSYDTVASFALNYPDDIEKTKIDPKKRSFGFFEITMLLSLFLSVLLAYILYGNYLFKFKDSNEK